ncbi:hypothetical protein AeRB84_011251 [Aphanomyces euteiches]|nr:hypothetical protein AeRB84_011251 [Aphanomyces euteiches]
MQRCRQTKHFEAKMNCSLLSIVRVVGFATVTEVSRELYIVASTMAQIMSSAARTSVPCTACHGLFFLASLAIHQKTCFRKYAFVDIACPSCKSLVRSGVYHNHVASCQGPAAVPPSKPREQQPPRETGPIGSPEPDGRIKCQKCKRSFTPDRVEKHQSVCQAHERVEKMQNQSIEHLQVVTWKPPSREKIKVRSGII